jgi:hypothetical protein
MYAPYDVLNIRCTHNSMPDLPPHTAPAYTQRSIEGVVLAPGLQLLLRGEPARPALGPCQQRL